MVASPDEALDGRRAVAYQIPMFDAFHRARLGRAGTRISGPVLDEGRDIAVRLIPTPKGVPPCVPTI